MLSLPFAASQLGYLLFGVALVLVYLASLLSARAYAACYEAHPVSRALSDVAKEAYGKRAETGTRILAYVFMTLARTRRRRHKTGSARTGAFRHASVDGDGARSPASGGAVVEGAAGCHVDIPRAAPRARAASESSRFLGTRRPASGKIKVKPRRRRESRRVGATRFRRRFDLES